MSASSRRRDDSSHGADPWWGDGEAASTPTAARAASRAPRRERARDGIGWLLLGIVLVPIDLTRRAMARSPLLRRVAIRAVVLVVVLVLLTSSVGVILINNVVIGRTAELGELDTQRRELRRDNALLAAEAAKLSAPSVVFNRASRELGMVRTPELPRFIYLDPGSRALTPLQRRRVAARDARLRAQAARRAAVAAAPSAAPKAAPASTQQVSGASAAAKEPMQ